MPRISLASIRSFFGGGPVTVAPTPTNLDAILGRPSSAGVNVTATTALGVPAIVQGVKLVAESVGKTELYPVRGTSRGGRDPEVNHPTYEVLRHAPNSYQSAYTFWSTLMTHALTQGHGLAQVRRVGRVVTGLHLMDPEIRPKVDGDRIIYGDIDGRDVVAIRGISWDGIDSWAALELSRDVIGTRIAEAKFQASIYGNGGAPNGVIEYDVDPGKEQREETRKGFEAIHRGPGRAGRLGQIWGGKWKPTDYSPADLKLVDGANFGVSEACRIFNLQGWMLGVPNAIRPSSTEEGMNLFVQLTLSPWFKQIQSELALKLLTPEERRDLSFWHDTRGLTRGDSRSQVDEAVSLSMNGIVSPNRAAVELGYEPSDDPRMDEPWFTTNNRQPLSEIRPGEATQPKVNRPDRPAEDDGAGGGEGEDLDPLLQSEGDAHE